MKMTAHQGENGYVAVCRCAYKEHTPIHVNFLPIVWLHIKNLNLLETKNCSKIWSNLRI